MLTLVRFDQLHPWSRQVPIFREFDASTKILVADLKVTLPFSVPKNVVCLSLSLSSLDTYTMFRLIQPTLP